MLRWARRNRPTRAALIERKHELDGQIRVLAAEIRRREARNQPTAQAENRIAHLRNLHYRTRLEIDRAQPES
jgi:hypothetical protein